MMSIILKENVLPGSAEAVVNHRIHPIQTVEEVIEYDKYLIDDPSIEIEIKGNDFIVSQIKINKIGFILFFVFIESSSHLTIWIRFIWLQHNKEIDRSSI